MAKPEAQNLEEDKLAHALVSRRLFSREELQQFRAADNHGDTDPLLVRLVKAGLLTVGQAKRLAPEITSLVNQQIPGYEMLQKLGQGSMGTVFKARQISMDREVAIKILHPRLIANEVYLERFKREAHLAAKFSSNNVVQAIDVGSAGKLHYFIMEYVEGTTIKEILEKGKVFEEKEAVDIVLQIAQAMLHAHRRQLIHRDIKPANIILTSDGIAKLADLGMSRDTTDQARIEEEKGMTIGTPYYIAPEQIYGKGAVDSRADVYSLGATLYHMVTGQPPFPYPKTTQVLQAHLKENLTPPDHINTKLSTGLGEVVELMMAKNRDERYPSPEELISDLESLWQGKRPKFARQRSETTMLEQLAHGEAVEDEERKRKPKKKKKGPEPEMVPIIWVYVLAVVVIFSLVGNLILMLR
ncbi:MAG: serine/threonine protein kinase [Gemmataceae bacterium]|nr:serine/threonine protein kinase [Gemmataceae bacterium]MCI0741854.1 serine/threonine protein kinase [Gemmataceae bacterium]